MNVSVPAHQFGTCDRCGCWWLIEGPFALRADGDLCGDEPGDTPCTGIVRADPK